jgi:glucosamine-6-phosphate deaminase
MWLPSTFMPTLPGKLFFLRELAGPLVAEVN